MRLENAHRLPRLHQQRLILLQDLRVAGNDTIKRSSCARPRPDTAINNRSSSGRSATSGSRLFINSRNGPSVTHSSHSAIRGHAGHAQRAGCQFSSSIGTSSCFGGSQCFIKWPWPHEVPQCARRRDRVRSQHMLGVLAERRRAHRRDESEIRKLHRLRNETKIAKHRIDAGL